MQTIQVTDRAKRLLERFGTSSEFGNSYTEFQSAMLEAIGAVIDLLGYYNADMQITGKDLAALFALQQYADLAAELHKGFVEAQDKANIKPFGAAD